MKLCHIDHIVLNVRDVSATIRFYDDVLGMEPKEVQPGRWAMHFGTNKISLHDIRNATELGRDAIPGSANFCVMSGMSIEKVLSVLDAKGIDIVSGPTREIGAAGPLMSVYVRDPDGNLIEIGASL